MNLKDTLREVAGLLGLDPATTAAYADEYWMPSGDPRIPPEYAFAHADGRFLYALIRAYRPRRVLESGFARGGSAGYIAAALRQTERETGECGLLVAVDVTPWVKTVGGPPDEARLVTLIQADICEYVKRPDAGVFDFIHEDASHEFHTVRAVYEALPTLMPCGGVIVSHDTATGVKDYIFGGIRNAGLEVPPLYQYDESPCGFSVMCYEGVGG